jgi:hypothetical protein
MLPENPASAANDIAARDLISSYFRFPWRVDPMDFRAFARVFAPPDVRLSTRATLPATPPGGTSGVCCGPMPGQPP